MTSTIFFLLTKTPNLTGKQQQNLRERTDTDIFDQQMELDNDEQRLLGVDQPRESLNTKVGRSHDGDETHDRRL